ncbi:hypothetical protein RRG08_005558 [Elysia crispata]|uniref:Uncharacterized protein n=1 Tax=Elysia crispata TaxID=231223 RepID=A0AAE1ALK4_9GAST|nr:hypothetical protein RRG08_005558 [Elysia crispata]
MATTVPASPGRNGIRVHSGYRQRPRSTGIIDARSATPDNAGQAKGFRLSKTLIESNFDLDLVLPVSTSKTE